MSKQIVPGCWMEINVCKGYCGSSYSTGHIDGETESYDPQVPCCKPNALHGPTLAPVCSSGKPFNSHLTLSARGPS